MQRRKRIGFALGLAAIGLVYTWIAAVRAVPAVRARKARLRASRRGEA